MSHPQRLLLAASEELYPSVRQELALCGIDLQVARQRASSLPRQEAHGFLVTKPAELNYGQVDARLSESPGLLLVYGADSPYGWADQVADEIRENGCWEVVRLTLVAEQERALLGGEPEGKWLRRMCRHLAAYGRMSYVCTRREVDEAVRQWPRYLAWKERFFLELGDICDKEGISLRSVSRALGLDRRIGQEWWFPAREDHAQICAWLIREAAALLEKANIRRIVLWGPWSLWKQMPVGWLKDYEVLLYIKQDEPFPNDIFPTWSIRHDWEKALVQADLLVIAQQDRVIGEQPLSVLASIMRQAIVLDAAGCFPLQEARAYLSFYRAIGEKTNVWE